MPPGTTGRTVLETDRLILRTFTEADVDALVELHSDPEVTRFITNGEPTPRDVVVTEILPAFLRHYETYRGYGFWAAIERATGEFVGWFHLRPNPDHPVADEPELGYRLRRSAWGKGYATEGSRALIDRAFTELGAARVYAETMTVTSAPAASWRSPASASSARSTPSGRSGSPAMSMATSSTRSPAPSGRKTDARDRAVSGLRDRDAADQSSPRRTLLNVT